MEANIWKVGECIERRRNIKENKRVCECTTYKTSPFTT